MFEIKKGKTQFVPVRLFNVNGDGQLAVNYTDVTASLLRSDNSIVNIGVSSSAWFEASSSVFYGLGTYQLQLHSASITNTGSLTYAVHAGPNVPAVPFLGVLKVTEVNESDTFNVAVNMSSSLTPLSASVGASLERLRIVSEGRWKIDTLTNKLTLYQNDATTPFIVFGLTGSDGTPTTTNPFERRPVG